MPLRKKLKQKLPSKKTVKKAVPVKPVAKKKLVEKKLVEKKLVEKKVPAKKKVVIEKKVLPAKKKIQTERPVSNSKLKSLSILRVIANGEPGINRIALQVAKKLGIKTAGACMKNFNVVDKGPFPELKQYNLKPVAKTWGEVLSLNTKAADASILFYKEIPKDSFVGQICEKNNKAYAIVVTGTESEFIKSAKAAALVLKLALQEKEEINLHIVGTVLVKGTKEQLTTIYKQIAKVLTLLQE